MLEHTYDTGWFEPLAEHRITIISQCPGWAEISQHVVKHGQASQLNEGELNGDGGDDNNLWWNCSLF